MKKRYKVENLGCAHCAAQMEDSIKKIDGVTDANLSFMTEKLKIEFEDENKLDSILDQASEIISSIEANAVLVR